MQLMQQATVHAYINITIARSSVVVVSVLGKHADSFRPTLRHRSIRTVHWRLAARTQQGAPCSYKNYSVVKCTCFDAVAV